MPALSTKAQAQARGQTVGGVILQTLGCLIEGTFLTQGIIWGIEMHPMFNNPLAATNLRAFWGNWSVTLVLP